MVDGVEMFVPAPRQTPVSPPDPQKSMQKQIPWEKNSTKVKEKPGNTLASALVACAANHHLSFVGAFST